MDCTAEKSAPVRAAALAVLLALTVVAVREGLALAGLRMFNTWPLFLLVIVYATYTGGWLAGTAGAAVGLLDVSGILATPGVSLGLEDTALRLTMLAPMLAGVIVLVHLLKQHGDRAIAAERDGLQSQQRMQELDNARRLAETLDALDEVVWSASADGARVLSISAAAQRLFGYPPAQFVREPDLRQRLILPDDRPAVAAAFADIAANSGLDLEYRILRSDGAIRRVRDRARLSRDAAGQPLRLDGFVIDITAEREAEARMRRVANLYAALSECNEAIIRIDSRDKLYREVCRIAVDFGRLRMAWIGCVVDGRLRPAASFGARVDYVEHLDLALDPALAAGQMPSADAVLSGNHAICNDIERDAESTPWRDQALACGFRAGAAFPVRNGGVVVGNLTVYAMEPGFFDEQLVKLLEEMALDVSFAVDRFAQAAERKRAEAEILRLNVELERRVAERTAQLKISNRDLESFSYTVSHDLRAPLRAINGFANMLVEGEAGRLSPEGLVLLDRVMANTHKMGELIDNILEYSRIGRARLTPAPTDLQRLVEDVVNELRPAYPASDVVIHPLPQASVDPIMMRQVFSNLIGNALKFSAKSSAPRVEIGSRLNGDGAEFYVRDNGAGFDMKYADKLFGMFQRMHGATEYSGTGVGLAIVKRLIERHGGSIRAEAAPGKGATFSFVLGG